MNRRLRYWTENVAIMLAICGTGATIGFLIGAWHG